MSPNFPRLAAAWELLATARQKSGDTVGAENALRASLAADPGRIAAAAKLAGMLTPRHRAKEAIALLAPLAAGAADPALLTAYGAALRSEGRNEEAVEFYQRALNATPEGPEAEHNLAGALGDAHQFGESLEVVSGALARGLEAPETWLVQGRSLSGLGRFDEAEASFRKAIERRPTYIDAHQDLAQLIWMRTEDVETASRDLNAALRLFPSDAALVLAKARLFEYAAGDLAAYSVLAEPAASRSHDPMVQTAAAGLAMSFDPDVALRHAQHAHSVAPADAAVQAMLSRAYLAVGMADAAARIAESLASDWPEDQQPVTLAATAWRMLGDFRYRDLFDYGCLVKSQTIETPAGWTTLAAYLHDLAISLRAAHRLRAHPIGQSLRGGAQTSQSLTRSEDPAIKAFFLAIDQPIRNYIEALAGRDDVLGRRAGRDYRFRRGLVSAAQARRTSRRSYPPARLDLVGLSRRAAGGDR